MKGTYRFYKNGELIYAQSNLITTFGQDYLRRYLTNQVANVGDALAVGALGTAPTVNDVALGFEFSRAPVVVRSISGTNIVIKATLNNDLGGQIYEAGLFPTVSNDAAGLYGTQLLATFDTTQELWTQLGATAPLVDSTNYRIGSQSMQFSGASVSGNLMQRQVSLDLSGYSPSDQFVALHYYTAAAAISPTIFFMTSASDYYSYTYSLPIATNSLVSQTMTKSNFTTTGSPNWNNINYLQVGLSTTGSYTFDFDGLIVNDLDPYQNYSLISHAALSTPLTKLTGEDFDIEYTLGVSFG